MIRAVNVRLRDASIPDTPRRNTERGVGGVARLEQSRGRVQTVGDVLSSEVSGLKECVAVVHETNEAKAVDCWAYA